MLKNTPLVSIIMPVYNSSSYLVAALDSIIYQTYKNWELIAIDDASFDSSSLILKHYADLDPRIRIIKNKKNIGVGKSLDLGVSLAKGSLIARMDGDDVSYPDRLMKQVKYLLKHPKVIALGGQCRLINEYGEYIGDKKFPTSYKKLYAMLYNVVPIQHPALMVNTALLPKGFTWYDGWRNAQDLYLFFKLVNFGKLANLDCFILDYRYYRASSSLKDPKSTFKLTNEIRNIGTAMFGYKPTFKARLVNILQTIVVGLLPNSLIFILYKYLRFLINGSKTYKAKKVPTATKKIIAYSTIHASGL